MTDRTFTIIKPEAVAAGHAGLILDRILAAGFRVAAIRCVDLSRNEAERFYAVHRGKAFFDDLIRYMTSGPVWVAVLVREEAVATLRALVGATDPARAAEGTLRCDFGRSIEHNAIHASDSDEHAAAEAAQFFTEHDLILTAYVDRQER